MKTKMVFIALAMVILGATFSANAQETKKKYAFAYATWSYDYSQKLLYITPVVTGKCIYKSYYSSYECPQVASLSLQWHAKFKTIVEKSFQFKEETTLWGDDYDKTDEYRTEFIGRYKQSGYTIRYVDDFWYRDELK